MSEIIKAEGIVLSLVFKCPHCGKMNILNRSTMPTATTVFNDEVELFYLEPCHFCRTEIKVGVVAISE